MGWKTVKEVFRIGHIVHMSDELLCIGSPYISAIITVTPDGIIRKKYDWGSDADLQRYQEEITERPEKFRAAMEQEDQFSGSIPVYTYDGGRQIIQKFCETLGYPNCTHDGELMYDNTFSINREKIIQRAIRNTKSRIASFENKIKELQQDLNQRQAWLRTAKQDLLSLEDQSMTDI